MEQARREVTLTDWDGINYGARFWLMVKRITDLGGMPDVSIGYVDNVPRHKDGTRRQVARVSFDGNRVRDTWVHGWACDIGYVAAVTA